MGVVDTLVQKGSAMYLKFAVGSVIGISLGTLGGCAVDDVGSTELEVSVPAPQSLVYDECDKVIAAATVPASNVRDLVPPELYVVGQEVGFASLVVTSYQCENATTAKGSSAALTSQIGVLIGPPDGTGTVNSYMLTLNSDFPAIAQVIRDAGGSALVNMNQSYAETINGAGLLQTDVVVGHPYQSPFEIHTVSVGFGFPDANFTSNWWQAGEYGLIKKAFTVAELFNDVCVGTISAQPGSELAAIMGSTSLPLNVICFQAQVPHAEGVVSVLE